MCLLIVEIMLLVGGLYALLAGKVRLTKNMLLEGWRARVAGLFLIAPLPLAFLTGVLIALSSGPGGVSEPAQSAAAIIELLLVFGGLLGAVIFAVVTKPKESGKPKEVQVPPLQT